MAKARPASSTTTEPSDNECSVCNELFTVPKLLPCGHVLCRHCLVTWLQSQPQAHCPLCRCPVLEPVKSAAASNNYDVVYYKYEFMSLHDNQAVVNPGMVAAASNNWDDVADSFPTDLAMEELVEAERLLNKNHQCCFCQKAKATSLCLDCNDSFCASCKNGHTNQKISRHHVMQALTSLTADQLVSHRPSPCPAHADKACELYCPSHDTSMCTVCFASRHRSCPDVTDLQHKADESRAVLQQVANRLTQAGMMLDQGLSELDQHLQDKKKKSKASLAELKAVCNRLKSAIDTYYISVEQEVEEDCSDVSKKVNDNKACLSQRRGRVTSESGIVERMQGIKKHDAIITMTSAMQKRINDLVLCGTFSNSLNFIEHKDLLVNEGIEKQILQQLPSVGTFATQLTEPGTSGAEWPYQSNMLVSQPQIWNEFPNEPISRKKCDYYDDRRTPRNRDVFSREYSTEFRTGFRDGDERQRPGNTFIDERDRASWSTNQDQIWCFHGNHGQNIVLSNGSMTAERTGQDTHGGIVLGDNRMEFNYLYEVRVESRLQGAGSNMFIGAINQDPSPDFTEIPHTNFNNFSWRGAVVIRPQSGRQRNWNVGAKLNNLPQNSTLGVLLDSSGNLHLYVNGRDEGVAVRNIQGNYWPMFELYGQYRKITALPVTAVSSNPNRRFADSYYDDYKYAGLPTPNYWFQEQKSFKSGT